MRKMMMLLSVLVVGIAASAWAQDTQDPLHSWCVTACPENNGGTVTPINAGSWGFYASPGPLSGTDYLIEILIPNNEDTGSISFAGNGGSANANVSISATATKFSSTAWSFNSNSTLDVYLGLSNASPNNPVNAWSGLTQGVDSGATGYYVYQADLGTNGTSGWTIPKAADEATGPVFDGLVGIPAGALIVAFLEGTTEQHPTVATANSGALFFNSGDINPLGNLVPEPSSIVLFGSMLVGQVPS